MNLSKLWKWDKKKINCDVKQESGNPAFDDLRERLAELAGVNLKDLLDEMKRTQVAHARSKRGGTGKLKPLTETTEDDMEESVTPPSDYDSIKKYKDILHRSHIVDATHTIVHNYDEHNTLGQFTNVASRNIKKRFTATLPLSPPKRIAAEVQREMAKSIILPNPEETKAASMRLQRKLAKQRAARKKLAAAGDASLSSEDDMDGNRDNGPNYRVQSKFPVAATDALSNALKPPSTPSFASQQNPEFLDGMIYLARVGGPKNRTKTPEHNKSAGGSDEAKPTRKKSFVDNYNEVEQKDMLNKEQEAMALAAAAAAAANSAADGNKDDNKNWGHPLSSPHLMNAFDNDDDDNQDDLLAADDRESKLYCVKALCNWSRRPENAKRLSAEGAIRALMHLALEPIPKILFYCAGAFRFMSENLVLATAMIDDGAISVVAEVINSAYMDDTIIGNLTITLVNLTRVIGKEGQVVEQMIHQALTNILSTHTDLSSSCARGLYNLTCVDNSYPFIEKVVRAIINLASTTTASNVKHICAAALCNLADMKSVRSRMLEEGVISVLSSLSKGCDTRTKRVCAVVLQNLSASKATRVEMVARGAVQAAHLLSADADTIILRCVSLTLSRLSAEPANAVRIIHELGISALCNIAIKCPSVPGISQPVATAFQLLSGTEAKSETTNVRTSMVSEGTVPAVAALLKHSNDVYTLQHCLLTLCNLLLEEENQLPVVQQGLIATLITLSRHDNITIKDFSSLAFLNLSLNDESRKSAVIAGAVVAIIDLAKEKSVVTKTRCAAALMNLATITPSKDSTSGLGNLMDRMINDGIIPALVTLLSTDHSETVRYSCAALCRICLTPSSGKMILDSGAVPTLVERAIKGDPQTQQYCGAVLSSLSFYDTCRVPLFEMNIIAALKKLAESEDDDLSKQRCLAAFSNLSCEESIQLKIVEQGVVEIISILADSYQESTYTYCARALCNLACAEGARLRVATEGGMRVLLMIGMVRSVDIHTKYWCVVALCNLLDMTTIDFMIEEGLVTATANLSRNTPTEDTVQWCAKIFNYLSSYPRGRIKMIEKGHILHALYSMIDSPNNDTRILAARTTSNLLFSADTRDVAIEAGALFTLQAGIISGNADASRHCLKALFSACKNVPLMPIIAKTSLPIALCIFAADCSDDRHDLAVKVLALMAWHPQSREELINKAFVDAYSHLVLTNMQQNSVEHFAIMMKYLSLSHVDKEELINQDETNSRGAFYHPKRSLSLLSSFSSKLEENGKFAIDGTISLLPLCMTVATRCLLAVPSCTEFIATSTTIAMLLQISDLCTADVEGDDLSSTKTLQQLQPPPGLNASLPESADNEAIAYHIAVAIYHIASCSTTTRVSSSCSNTIKVFQFLNRFPSCAELISVSLCHYISDPKSRKHYANRNIVTIILNILQNSTHHDVLYHGITCMFVLAKRSDCVEFLSDPVLMAVPTLLKLSKTSEARVRANCARTLKHMTSDTTDALEEGAVASLLSMYFQGRDRLVLSEDMGVPLIKPCPANDVTPPRCIEDDITDTLWFHEKVSTSGGPAGKGPPPPDPPSLTSEDSGTYTSIIDETDMDHDNNHMTKMAFAKMQTPLALRDKCLLTDADFEAVREDADDDEWVTVYDESTLDGSSMGGNNTGGTVDNKGTDDNNDDSNEYESDQWDDSSVEEQESLLTATTKIISGAALGPSSRKNSRNTSRSHNSSSATMDLNGSGGERNKSGTPTSSRSQSRSGSRAGTGVGFGSSHSVGSVTFETDAYTEHDPNDMDDYSGSTRNSLSPTTGSKSPKKLRYAVNDGRAMGMVHHQDDSKGGGESGGSSSEGGSFKGSKSESKHAGNAAASGSLSLDTHSRGNTSNPHNKAESKEQGKVDRRMSKKEQQAQGLFGSPGRQS